VEQRLLERDRLLRERGCNGLADLIVLVELLLLLLLLTGVQCRAKETYRERCAIKATLWGCREMISWRVVAVLLSL